MQFKAGKGKILELKLGGVRWKKMITSLWICLKILSLIRMSTLSADIKEITLKSTLLGFYLPCFVL